MPELDNNRPLDSRQFILAIKKLADSVAYGTDKSPFLGSGLEYVQSRPYVAGDPVKTIDWRVTARTGRPHVKEYESPKCLPVWFVVDTSASMALSSTSISKYQLAVQIAGGLALACLDRVSPVGVLGAGDRELTVRPSLSREKVMMWLHALRRFEYTESTRLSETLLALRPSLPDRTLIFIISDLHEPDSITAIKRLGQQHDLAVLLMRDPAEDSLPGAGFIRGREVESGRSFSISAKKQFTTIEQTTDALKKSAVDHFLIRTDQPFLAPLRLFLQSRNLLSR